MKKYMFNHRRGKKISYVNNKGFSYMELMVAMIIIGIVGAAFTGVVFTSGKASNSHKLDLEALTIAQDVIEEARAYRDNGGMLYEWKLANYASSKTVEYSGFSYEITVVLNNIDARLQEINVEVKHSASEKPVKLITRILSN